MRGLTRWHLGPLPIHIVGDDVRVTWDDGYVDSRCMGCNTYGDDPANTLWWDYLRMLMNPRFARTRA